MAIIWKFGDETQGQWDLWLNTGVRNDFAQAKATEVDVFTFKTSEEAWTLGDTIDYVVDSQFWGSEVYGWDDAAWTTYIDDAGDLVAGHELTFTNVASDNKVPVYVYVRKTHGGEKEYAAYQVFVDSHNPVFGAEQISIQPALHRNSETHAVEEYWFNKEDVVAVGGEEATGATLTITFDDTEGGTLISSGISALKYSTAYEDLENPVSWTDFQEIAVQSVTYDEETGKYTLTAYLPDSVDKTGTNIADGNYYRFKLVDGVGNESDIKVFQAAVDDTAEVPVYEPTMIWQDATAPVIEEANMALHGTHVNNDVTQPINGKGPEDENFQVITDRNKPGTPYQFTVNGIAPTQAADKGTPLSIVVTYTGAYQKLILEDGNYILGEATAFDGSVGYTGTLDNWTSEAMSLYPTVPGTEAIGYYKVEAKVVDEAGNETAYDPFYVYFDNTLPASPDVVLNDESAVYDADAKTSYVKVFGEDTSVTVAPGSYGELAEGLYAIELMKELDGTPVYEYAVSTGALDIPALVGARAYFDPAGWNETPGAINLDNFTNFWGVASVEDGVVKDNAYSVIFFSKNEAGVESSTYVDQVSVVRFVVDSTAPVDLEFIPGEAGTIVDDIHWFSDDGADVSLTFKAYDKWNGTKDAESLNHVSGVASFNVVGGSEYAAELDDTNPADVYYKYVIDNIRTGTPGIVEYDFTATDVAGNESVKYSDEGGLPLQIGIDAAAPVINNVWVTWGDEEDQKRLVENGTVVFNAADLAAFDEQTITKFWLTIDVADVSGATTGETKGVGLTDNDTKTYYQIDGGLATAFLEAGTKTDLNDIVEDTTYVYGLKYTDLFDHGVADDPVEYTVIFDNGPVFTVAGDYTVNGPADGVTPKGPTTADQAVAAFNELNTYASAFDLAFNIATHSGLQTLTMTKETAEGTVTIFSYDAEEAPIDTNFTFNSADGEKVALWQLEEGDNKYTVTIQDKAGNEAVVQEFSLKYDTQVTGTVEVKDQSGTVITADEDGKYYVTTNNYKLVYGVVDTEENPELSGADLVYYKEDGDADYENHLILGWDQPVYGKGDGVTTIHQAIVTDKAGNTDNGIEATVVVDQTKPVISVAALPPVFTTVKTAVTGKRDFIQTTNPDIIPAGPIDENQGLTVNWTTLIAPNNFNINVIDANIAKVLLNGEELDHTSIKFALSTYGGDDADAVIEEGTTTWTITGIDKVDYKTTVTVTISYDATDPEITGIKFGSYEAQDTDGGMNKVEALDHKVYVTDAKNFTFTMTVTDNVDENVKVYYTFVDKDDDFDTIGDWSDWTEVVDGSMKIESPDEGFYHFAAVDQAGNVIQSKYYYVAEATQPTQPTVWYKDEKGAIYTDVDSKGWFSKPMQVYAEFENTASYDQTNYIAVNFDLEAYQETYLSTGSYAEALRAAIHLGEEDQDEYLLTSKVTTVAPGDGHTWTWTTDGFVGEKHEYWMFSIDAGDNVTKDQFKYQLVKVDTIAPTLTLDLQGYAGEWDGDVFTGVWTNESVFINAEAEDKDSGLFSLTPGSSWAQTVSSATSEGTTQVFTATDYAGNVTTKTVIVKVDKIDPEMDVDLGGYTPGTWSTDPVTITVTASDALSGLAEDPSGVYVIEETTTVTLVAKDNAGNFVEQVIEVLIDNSDLVINLDSHGYEFGTWTNEAVTVDVTATSTSPITYITPSPVNFEEEGDVNFDFTATNEAGKTVTETKNIKIDWTAPVAEVDLNGYEEGSWTKEDVEITASATDALSGIKESTYVDQTISEEGETEVVMTATDEAGNVTTDTVVVKIDKTAPVAEYNLNGYEVGTWTKEDVEITASATDALSGIATSTYVDQTISEEGETPVVMEATDVAGNVTTDTVVVKIDKTAPVIERTDEYQDGTWSNVPVTITATAYDALSGLVTPATYEITVEESTVVELVAEDAAGNVTVQTVNVLIDTGYPVITYDAGDYEFGTWTKEDVTVDVTATSLSPIVDMTVSPVVITEEGDQEVEFFATNAAGNTTTEYKNVKIDKTAPVASVDLNGYEEDTWTNEDVEITASATDALSGIAESTYVDQTISEEGETTVVMDATDVAGNATSDTVLIKIDKTAPVASVDLNGYEAGTWTKEDVQITASATDALSGIATSTYADQTISAEGVQTVVMEATDVAGNVTTDAVVVKIDKSGPVIERTDDYADGTWSKTAVTITATATDNLSGILSGELIVPQVSFEQKVTAEGKTTVEWTVADMVGNSSTMTAEVWVDTVAPELILDAGAYEFGSWTNEAVTVTVDATDATSGVKAHTESPLAFEEEGVYQQMFFAEDNAGNVTSTVKSIKIDMTAPVIERTDEYQDGTWSSVPVTITATAYDALSGLVTPATYEITLDESTVVELVAEDAAGNKTVQTVNVLIDTGAPVLTLDAGDYVFGEWTNKDVTVNVAAASLSPIVSMTASPVVITAEGTTNQEFFATNAAGVTTTEYRWIRIDKTLPVVVSASYAPAEDLTPFVVVTASFSDAGGSGLKNGEYSFDGNTWEVYDGSFNVYQNTPIYFRATDNAGNVSGITELNVSNIAIDYAEVEGEGTVKNALLETEYGVSGKYLVDALDLGNITGKLTVKNGGKSVFTANIEYGVITKTSNKDGSKTFMLDNSKSTVIDLTVNEKKTAGSTEWDIQFVTDDGRFIEGDNGDDNWMTITETEYDLGILNYDGEVFENWVGFGDEIDYRVFTLESSAKLQFALESEDTAKMTVYQLNTKTGKLKSLGNVTISAKEIGTTKWTKDLLVEEGTYYISVQSTNKKAASGTGAGEYEVSVAGEFYPVISDDAKINNTWKTATDLGGDYAEGWVGFGNASDFYKFSVDENGKIAFDMEEDTYKAVLAKELKITCLTDTGKSVALEQLDKDTLVSKKEMAAGEYIIGVTCSNVKKYNTSYGVGIAVL